MNIFPLLTTGRIGVLVVGFSSMLAACSSEPSATDIEKVMRADGAKAKGTVIHEVRKIACAPAQGAAGYMCDVEVDATIPQPFFGNALRNKAVIKLRFFQDGGAWQTGMN